MVCLNGNFKSISDQKNNSQNFSAFFLHFFSYRWISVQFIGTCTISKTWITNKATSKQRWMNKTSTMHRHNSICLYNSLSICLYTGKTNTLAAMFVSNLTNKEETKTPAATFITDVTELRNFTIPNRLQKSPTSEQTQMLVFSSRLSQHDDFSMPELCHVYRHL